MSRKKLSKKKCSKLLHYGTPMKIPSANFWLLYAEVQTIRHSEGTGVASQVYVVKNTSKTKKGASVSNHYFTILTSHTPTL